MYGLMINALVLTSDVLLLSVATYDFIDNSN